MDTLVSIHSLLRWIVLLAGLASVAVALAAWLGSALPDRLTRQAMLIFAVSLDVQVLLGILIYVLGNHWQNPARQFRLEHPIMMLLALIVAHVAAARARRAATPVSAVRGRALGSAISLILVLAGIPWTR